LRWTRPLNELVEATLAAATDTSKDQGTWIEHMLTSTHPRRGRSIPANANAPERTLACRSENTIEVIRQTATSVRLTYLDRSVAPHRSLLIGEHETTNLPTPVDRTNQINGSHSWRTSVRQLIPCISGIGSHHVSAPGEKRERYVKGRQENKGSRRSVSIAPPLAGRGTDCSRETGKQGTRAMGSDSDAGMEWRRALRASTSGERHITSIYERTNRNSGA
jgi:hypothetical protein